MKRGTKQFAVCIDNRDYEASLILRKLYPIIPDARAAKDQLLRIVDESGEDYLYPKDYFVLVDFPKPVEKRIRQLADPLVNKEARNRVMREMADTETW